MSAVEVAIKLDIPESQATLAILGILEVKGTRKNTYELRNKIVHQGKKDVTADESLNLAILTADGTVSFLNGLVP